MLGQSVDTNAGDSKAQLRLRCSASLVAWQLHILPRFTTTVTLVNSSDALAPYTSPPRPRDELHHSYVLYLCDQPPSYMPSKVAWNGTYYDQTADSRFKLKNYANPQGCWLAHCSELLYCQWWQLEGCDHC